MRKKFFGLFMFLLIAGSLSRSASAQDQVLVPKIDGDFWRIAGDPDLGQYTSPKQQPVDFGIWQAADGTWQLWSCIRSTKLDGKTRLFYRWQANKITDSNWTPMGIAMMADPNFGETEGGLQAPFVLKVGSDYVMFYGTWDHIAIAKSKDGKTFARQLMPDGTSGIFGEEVGANTRDPQVIKIKSLYYLYYTAYPNRHGVDFVRTSKDLVHWSAPPKYPSRAHRETGLIRPSARLSTTTRIRATTTCCAINSTAKTGSSRCIDRRTHWTLAKTPIKILLRRCRTPRQRLLSMRGRLISLCCCQI